MAKRFETLRVSIHDIDPQELQPRAAPAAARGIAPGEPPTTSFRSDAEAARFYLANLMARAETPAIRSLSPDGPPPAAAPEQVPNLVETREAPDEVPLTGTRLVPFEQRQRGVPVFGSRVMVEIDQNQGFVSASVNVAAVEDIPTEPDIDANRAAQSLAEQINVDRAQLPAPRLVILPLPDVDENQLAWHFHRVEMTPPRSGAADVPPYEAAPGTCCDVGAPPLAPDFDYFIDARNAALLYFFSNQPHQDIPTWCRGSDEDNAVQTFFGRSNAGGYEMNNNFEDILTFDMRYMLIEQDPTPNSPVHNASNDWQATNKAAVSAHVNAARVMDFLFSVLRRDSIDDSGLPLENIVNCVSEDVDVADRPQWVNAVWWKGKMWYGQKHVGGNLQSLARHLDIIAHELTHGVTESTAGLVYRDLHGALNESFSDIFGVIIRNWYLASDRHDLSTWSWDMGAGLGAGGNPLRNMQNPSSVGSWWRPDDHGGWTQVNGYPDHMNMYVPLPINYDNGGVHIFSNIHNRAAYNLLTSTDPATGNVVLTPEEVAVLYYLCLRRLSALSDFTDARAELLNVANVLYGGSPARSAEVTTAIGDAYDAVGIQ